ncbi:MAG: AAA family ATPase, partial [Myxococcota bacterium]
MVLAHLGAAVPTAAAARAVGDRVVRRFVGRTAELTRLRRAYGDAVRGIGRCVVIVGPSGLGKTSLLDRLIADLGGGDTGDFIALPGRCHERESLPYKALDGPVDALCQHLLALGPDRRQLLIGRDIGFLARLFPVLRRVPECAAAPEPAGFSADAVRARAIAALREIVDRLGESRPVILRIEDLHWADRDSLDLLVELLRPPSPRSLLVLTTVRSENLALDERSPLRQALEVLTGELGAERIELGPLSGDEQRQLVARQLGERQRGRRLDPDTVAALLAALGGDLAGNPMLLTELTCHLDQLPAQLRDGPSDTLLERILDRRISVLPAPARAILELIAVAGEPTRVSDLAAALDIGETERERTFALLCSNMLIRLARSEPELWLDCYHDKVREVTLRRMSLELCGELHHRIAEVLDRDENSAAAAARLGRHYAAAGVRSSAARHFIRAGHAAFEQLAYDRAGELYISALSALGRLVYRAESSRDRTAAGDAEIERLHCRARLGLAECLRMADHYERALGHLELARSIAERHDLRAELADIHFLCGTVHYARFDLDRCLREHTRSRQLAEDLG